MFISIDNKLFDILNEYFDNKIQNFNISLLPDSIIISFLIDDILKQFKLTDEDVDKSFFEIIIEIKRLLLTK